MRKNSVFRALLCVWAILACYQLFAADEQKMGLKVGAKITDISAPDQSGKTRTFKNLSGPNGAIIVFYRSAKW